MTSPTTAIWDREVPAFILHHRVADFDTWLAGYDGAAGLQTSKGIIGHAANGWVDDPAMVSIYHQAESFDTLRAFLADPELQTAMHAAGVISAPEVSFQTGGWAKVLLITRRRADAFHVPRSIPVGDIAEPRPRGSVPRGKEQSMTTVMAHHEVKDRDHWLASPKRAEALGSIGITNIRTFADPQNPNKVGLLMEVPDMDALQQAMQTPEFGQAMADDGVLPDTVVFLVES